MLFRWFIVFGVFWLGLPLCATESIQIETYGDSLTAGFLADTSLQKTPEIEKLSELLNSLAFGFLQKNRELMKKFEANDSAWPRFLLDALREKDKSVSELFNLAVSGSKSSGIHSQIETVGMTSKKTWGFVFVGHNDLCHIKGETAELVRQFEENLNQSLAAWDKNHRNSLMFLIPAGPIYQLYPVLENYVWFQSGQKTFKCQDAWTKYFPYCATFYQRYKRGELESYLKPRGASINQALLEISNAWNRKSTQGNRFLYLDAQWPLPLHPEYFALDCYHIAEEGQRIFARNILDAIWRTVPKEDLDLGR